MAINKTNKNNSNNDLDNTNKNKLKILVFGAGVVGSVMIHYLCEVGNHVTVCARSTYNELKEKGLIIRHYAQRKTTVDHPEIVNEVDLTERYDIVFSVMQGQQHASLLDTLCKINTELVVLVGNNMESEVYDTYIREHQVSERRVLYGFQGTGGHREDGKIMAVRMSNVKLNLGGLHSSGKPEDMELIKKAFNVKGYQIEEIKDMYAFYIYHVAEIMPLVYLSYRYDCNLKRATSEDIKMVMRACKEAMELLKANGVNPMPEGADTYYEGIKEKIVYGVYRVICKNVIGKLSISDHCQNAVEEMKYLDRMFEKFRNEHQNKDMPTWDTMRKWAEPVFN